MLFRNGHIFKLYLFEEDINQDVTEVKVRFINQNIILNQSIVFHVDSFITNQQ